MARRVCVLQDYLRMGGTERNSLALCHHLNSKGDDVTLVTARPGGVLEPSAKALGVRHVVVQPFDLKVNWFPPSTSQKMDTLGSYDQVILMGRVANEYGWRIKKKDTSVELVATIRTGRKLTKQYCRTLQCADKVWVNSGYAAERAYALGVGKAKVETVENYQIHPLSDGERRFQRDDVRRAFGLAETPKVVFLKVAAFRPGKQHEALIRLFAEIRGAMGSQKSWELWLVGSGPQEKRCRQIVSKCGLEEHVRFFGIQLDVSKYYYGADFAISASGEESNSNFLQEARRAGLPILALRAGGSAEGVPSESDKIQWLSDFNALKHALSSKLEVES